MKKKKKITKKVTVDSCARLETIEKELTLLFKKYGIGTFVVGYTDDLVSEVNTVMSGDKTTSVLGVGCFINKRLATILDRN